MPVDEYGNYTDPNGIQGPAPAPQPPLDELLPQMVAQDGGQAYTPESGGMPAPTDPYGGATTAPTAPASTTPEAPATPAPAATTSVPSPGSPAPYSGYVNPFNDAVHQTILKSLDTNSQTPSITDPALAAQATAYQGARERARRQQQEGVAERAHAAGATSGGLDSQINQGYEAAGRDIGAYNANLVGGEATSRRNALLNTLGLGAGVSAAGGSNQLGQDTLGFNVGTEEAALNRALMQALMGGA